MCSRGTSKNEKKKIIKHTDTVQEIQGVIGSERTFKIFPEERTSRMKITLSKKLEHNNLESEDSLNIAEGVRNG